MNNDKDIQHQPSATEHNPAEKNTPTHPEYNKTQGQLTGKPGQRYRSCSSSPKGGHTVEATDQAPPKTHRQTNP